MTIIEYVYRGIRKLLGERAPSAVEGGRSEVQGVAFTCIMDIANYSRWCLRHATDPKSIYTVMSEYNELVCDTLLRYPSLEKIELVGDSVLVIGMIHDETDSRTYVDMMSFATDMMNNIPRIQQVFEDDQVSLRIGVDKGMIYGNYLSHPKRFQVFGSTVNIASRLQSNTLEGTILMTDATDAVASLGNHASTIAEDSIADPITSWIPSTAGDFQFAKHSLDEACADPSFDADPPSYLVGRSQSEPTYMKGVRPLKRLSIGCQEMKGVGAHAVSVIY